MTTSGKRRRKHYIADLQSSASADFSAECNKAGVLKVVEGGHLIRCVFGLRGVCMCVFLSFVPDKMMWGGFFFAVIFSSSGLVQWLSGIEVVKLLQMNVYLDGSTIIIIIIIVAVIMVLRLVINDIILGGGCWKV